jgi:propionyl-CoA synthetase
MEEVLASHPDVAECAVLGIKDAVKGEVPCGFLVLKAGVTRPVAEIEKEIVALVREKIGPVAAFKLAITVARLPKTRSGKILRGTIKKIADGEPWTMPGTIEDPMVLEECKTALSGRACPKGGDDERRRLQHQHTQVSQAGRRDLAARDRKGRA